MTRERRKLAGALGLLAVASAVTVYALWPERALLPGKTPFVCVETGEVFSLSAGDLPLMFPARNPHTGRDTLLPAERRPDGSHVAMARYARAPLRDPNSTLGRLNHYVDPNTLELLTSPRQP